MHMPAPCPTEGLLYLSRAVHVGGSHGHSAALGRQGGALDPVCRCLLLSQAPERRKHTQAVLLRAQGRTSVGHDEPKAALWPSSLKHAFPFVSPQTLCGALNFIHCPE